MVSRGASVFHGWDAAAAHDPPQASDDATGRSSAPPDLTPRDPAFQAGLWVGRQFRFNPGDPVPVDRPVFVYDEGRTGWWVYEPADPGRGIPGGIWRPLETDSHGLLDAIHRRRPDLALELKEGPGGPGFSPDFRALAADYLFNDRRWREQRVATSPFWTGLRHALRGPEPGGVYGGRKRDGAAHYLRYINTRGGTIDLPTGKLHPHSPEWGCRAVTAGLYTPELVSEHRETFSRFFSRSLGPAYQAQYLSLAGLALTGRSQPLRGLVMVMGESGSGKGGLVAALVCAFGEYAQAVDNGWFSRRVGDIDDATARMIAHRVRLIAVDEVGADSRPHQSRLMSLTGDSMLSARRPHGKTVSDKIRAGVWTTAVDPPSGIAAWSGIRRRLATIPTIEKLRKADVIPGFEERPEVQDAVFTLVVLAARLVYETGYRAPEGDVVLKRAVLAEMDPLSAFLECLDDEWNGTPLRDLLEHIREHLGWADLSMQKLGRAVKHSGGWDSKREGGGGPVVLIRRRK